MLVQPGSGPALTPLAGLQSPPPSMVASSSTHPKRWQTGQLPVKRGQVVVAHRQVLLGQDKGAEAQRRPHLPPQSCTIRGGPQTHVVQCTPAASLPLCQLYSWLSASSSTSAAFRTGPAHLAQPHPQGSTLPADSPLPVSAEQPIPLAGSRGQCGSASAIADWSWP